MVSLRGIYEAEKYLFGISSFYLSAIISFITALYFILGFVFQIIFLLSTYYLTSNLLAFNESPTTLIFQLIIGSIIANIAGLVGFIYFIGNRKHITKIFQKDYSPTAKEMNYSMIYVCFNILLLIIYFLMLL